VEKGASQRPSKVIYDRKHTAISTSSPEDFNWKAIFDGAGYFHFTGITPALSEGMPAVVEAACRAAKEAGVVISCDLNYRKNLWTTEQAGKTMGKLLELVDYLIANEEDADKVLGIHAPDSDVIAGKLSRDGYTQVARRLVERFPNIRGIGITLRQSISASDNIWGAMYFTEGTAYFSREYNVHIVDRVGGGDSFAAGLLYGIGTGMSPQDTVEYAAAASCLKHSIELDVNLSTVAEIRQLMAGDGSGRVQR
jgi:2-dehydro-3-deoxygluconokinase